MPDLPDPSLPLKKRHEIYAQQRAKGVDQGTAWQRTIPFGTEHKGGRNSLKVSGHRCEQRPEVKKRIRWLIEEARRGSSEIKETFNRADIVRLNLEVTEALEDAYQAALRAAVSPVKLEQLRTVLASHLARQGKLAERGDVRIPDETAASECEAALQWMQSLEPCVCQKHLQP